MKTILLFLSLLILPTTAFAQTGLKQAYQREVGYLKSQQRTLQNRLKTVEAEGQKKSNQAQAQVKSLQQKWLFMQAESERLQGLLSDANINGPSSEDQSDALLGTYEQGRQSLSTLGYSVPEVEAVSANDFQNLYKVGIQGIAEGREVRSAEGTYFDKNGVSKKGTLTKIGRIAAYANGVALAPAGEGRFKVWPKTGDKQPGVVLFESVEKAMNPPEEKTLMDTIKAGGTIAYIIVVLGLFALLLLALRASLLFYHSSSKSFVKDLKAGLESLEGPTKMAKESKGIVAKSVSLLLDRGKPKVDDIDEIVGGLAPKVERFNTIIMVIAAIAPLLGLLGTVTGMIATFDIITEFGTGDPKLLSSGISEALITTKFGLIVAIPALVFGNIFRAWGDNIIDEMDHACLIVLGNRAQENTVFPKGTSAAVRAFSPQASNDICLVEDVV